MKKWRLSCRSPVWVRIGKIIYSSLFLIGLFLSGQSVYADEPVAPTISMTIQDPEPLEIVPGEFKTAKHTIGITTNNSKGYSLTLENNNDTTDLVSAVSSESRIPTISGEVSASNFPIGYGYSLDEIQFFPIPERRKRCDRLFSLCYWYRA